MPGWVFLDKKGKERREEDLFYENDVLNQQPKKSPRQKLLGSNIQVSKKTKRLGGKITGTSVGEG